MANFVVLNANELSKLNGGYYYDPRLIYNPGPHKFPTPGPIIKVPGPIICYWFNIKEKTQMSKNFTDLNTKELMNTDGGIFGIDDVALACAIGIGTAVAYGATYVYNRFIK